MSTGEEVRKAESAPHVDMTENATITHEPPAP